MADYIPTSLVEMPEVVMRKILGKCDFVAIQCLRRTCHTFRNFIDGTKPELFFNVIEITGDLREMSLVLFAGDVWQLHPPRRWQLHPAGRKISVTYQQIDKEKTKITWYRSDKNREKIMENENFSEFFFRDFGSILNCKLPILDQISVYCKEMEKIQKTLESSGIPLIKVHTVIIVDATCQEDVLGILTYTCPETLKHLEITCPRGMNDVWDISKILELEHWKKVEELNMRRIPVRAGIQNFDHFEIGKVCIEEVTMDDVIKVKENFLNSPSTTKHLQLYFLRFPDQARLIESFGQPYRNTDNFYIAQQKSWFFRRADNHVLFIDFSQNFLVFNIKKLENVPEGARVIG